MKITLRLARKSEASDVVDLLSELTELSVSKKRSTEFMENLFDRKDAFFFVAETGGKLVGFLSFYLIPNIRHAQLRGHIEDMIVSKKVRGGGIGSALLSHLKQFCKKKRIQAFYVGSPNSYIRAHTFYQKNGIVNTGKVFRYLL